MNSPSETLRNAIGSSWTAKTKFFALCAVILVIWMTQSVIHTYTSSGWVQDSQFENDVCRKTNECSKLPYRFQRMLLFFVDGLPYDQAKDAGLFSLFSDRTNVHKIWNVEFQATYGVVTSYLTGKVPTNVMGIPIEGDNFLRQMVQAGHNLFYMGDGKGDGWWDVLAAQHAILFNRTVPVWLNDYANSRAFAQFFNGDTDENSKKQAYQYLNDFKSNGASALFACQVVDKRNHKIHNKWDEATTKIIKRLAHDMLLVKEWVNQNPEYLLVLISDHGGDWKDDKVLSTHGPSGGGNEAFILFYNPSINPMSKQFEWLQTVDVAGTIAMYLDKVSIPAESLGRVASPTEDVETIFEVSKLNAMQFIKYAEHIGLKVDKEVESALTPSPDISKNIGQLSNFISETKEKLMYFYAFPFLTVGIYLLSFLTMYGIGCVADFGSVSNFLGSLRTANWLFSLLPVLFLVGYPVVFSMLNFEFWRGENSFLYGYVQPLILVAVLYGASMDEETEKGAKSIDRIRVWLLVWSTAVVGLGLYWYVLAQVWRDLGDVPAVAKGYLFYGHYAAVVFWVALELKNQWSRAYYQLLQAKDGTPSLMSRAFFGVYLTGIYYMVIYTILFTYDKEFRDGKIDDTVTHVPHMLAVYVMIIVHSAFLVLSPAISQRGLVIPLTTLVFTLMDDTERFVLVTFGTIMFEAIARLGNHSDEATNQTVFIGKQGRRLAVILLLHQAFYIHTIVGGTFELGDIQPKVPGIFDIARFGVLTGPFMLIHKFGYFLLTAVYGIRFSTPNGLAFVNLDKMKELRSYVWMFFMAYAFSSAFFYEIGNALFPMTINFIYTMVVIENALVMSLCMGGDILSSSVLPLLAPLCNRIRNSTKWDFGKFGKWKPREILPTPPDIEMEPMNLHHPEKAL